MDNAFRYFRRAYVLNLDQDRERMARVSGRLDRLEIEYERFAAVPPWPELRPRHPTLRAGHYACAASHRALLQRVWESGLERALIFEDDVVLRDDVHDWMRRIVSQLNAVSWDMFYLGLRLEEAGEKCAENLLQVRRGFHTHAYAVTRQAIPRLTASIDGVLATLLKVFDGYDDPTLLKICAIPILAIQEPDYSRTHGIRLDRVSQYFEHFDGDDFRRHCREMQQWAAEEEVSVQRALELLQAGQSPEAEAVCRRLLAAEPDNAEALHLLGVSAHQAARHEEAVDLIRQAIAIAPADPRYHINLAAVLGKMGRPDEAIGALRSALRLRGDLPEVHHNLGTALEQVGRFEEAAAAFHNAIALRPDFAQSHNNLGNALRKSGKFAAAADAYRRALALRPGFPTSHHGLGSILGELGQLDEMIASFRRSTEMEPHSPAARSALLYTLHYHPDYDAIRLSEEHREWDRRHGQPLASYIRPHENDRSGERRLRVGYVSADFRDHTVPRFIEPALTHHDRQRFEVFLYSDVTEPDAVTMRLQALGHTWRDVRKLDHEHLAQLIREDRIDILVDLRGHGAENRLPLFAMKPAPVQVNMVGYFDTTGLSAMDYRLTDEHQDPPGKTEQYHSERLIHLPQSCWCYRPDDDCPEVAAAPLERNGYVTFGCLNKIIKISRPCATIWTRVLEAVPGSRLLLSVAGDAEAAVREILEQYALPMARVDVLAKARTRREYLERYGRIDVALDTFPFAGITTTCDGLWMGVPHVTLGGGTSVSRAGCSILAAAALPELVTHTPDRFVETTVELARDPNRCRAIRMEMRQRLHASPLTDQCEFTRRLEDQYVWTWDAWRRKR